ncbi:hypothetical protein HaLaN_00038, partial [Haematococcus lacustris]
MWVGEVDLPTNVSLTAKWEAGADRTLLLEPRAASSAAEGSGFIIMCHYGLPGSQVFFRSWLPGQVQGLLHFLSFLLAQNLSLATAAPSPTSSWDTAPTSAHTLDSKDNILATDGIPAGHAVASHKL